MSGYFMCKYTPPTLFSITLTMVADSIGDSNLAFHSNWKFLIKINHFLQG